MTKSVPPSITETAFDCPYCGAYTSQFWRKLYSQSYEKDNPTPNIAYEEIEASIAADKNMPGEIKNDLLDHYGKLKLGKIISQSLSTGEYLNSRIENIFLTRCYNCDEIAVWVHDRLVHPPTRTGAPPNEDLPEDIVADFEEARSVLELSPRSAAAMLRLCIQKLCIELGEAGKNIDADIASLVAKGLNPLVQKSLDSVRVIGNESLHPGEINLNDDRDTAVRLFDLVNAIADQMISHPKNVNAIYEKLPARKREAIRERNEKAKKGILKRFKRDS